MATDVRYVELEPAAALGDADVAGMTDKQFRCYWTIIWYLYCNRGRMTADISKVAETCGQNAMEFESKVWPEISKKFRVRDGFLTHKRVTKELKAARKRLQAKRRAGLMSAQQRATERQQRSNRGPTKRKRKRKRSEDKLSKDISASVTQDIILSQPESQNAIAAPISQSNKMPASPSLSDRTIGWEALKAVVMQTTGGDRGVESLLQWLSLRIISNKVDQKKLASQMFDWLKRAEKSRNPAAYLITIAKGELGYRPKSRRL